MTARVLCILGLALLVIAPGAWGAAWAAEGISIAAKCISAHCERTGNVLSIPQGTTVELKVASSSGSPLETVKFVFSDGVELYGTVVQRMFTEAGKIDVTAIAYYEDGTRDKTVLSVHVIAAKPIKTILGIPEQTVYTALAVLAAYAVSYLAALLGM